MQRQLKRALEPLLVPIAAAIVFFEETLIRYLNAMMAALARLKLIARLEAWLKTLPPQGALLAFVAPVVILLPVKFAAFWFIAKGQFSLAFALVALGKVVGTAMVARIYRILHPTLVRMRWFAVADAWVFYWRDRLYAFVRAMPAWQKAHEMVQRIKVWARATVAGWFAR